MIFQIRKLLFMLVNVMFILVHTNRMNIYQITNSFPTEISPFIRKISVFDEQSFGH